MRKIINNVYINFFGALIIYSVTYFILTYYIYFIIGSNITDFEILSFKHFLVFNVFLNLFLVLIKWFLLALIIFVILKLLKYQYNYFKITICLIYSEMIFFITQIVTVLSLKNEYNISKNDVITSETFFYLKNFTNWFNDTILNNFNVLNLLYILLVSFLLSKNIIRNDFKSIVIVSLILLPLYLARLFLFN